MTQTSNEGRNSSELNTSELMELLISNQDLLKTDYLKIIENNNLNTLKRVLTFYDDFLSFASFKINFKVIDLFNSKEFSDFILNSWLKHSMKSFNGFVPENSVFDLFKIYDKLFINGHKNIIVQANDNFFFPNLKMLASKNNLFVEWEFKKQDEFWNFCKETYTIHNLNLVEVNASIRVISFLSKQIMSYTNDPKPIPKPKLNETLYKQITHENRSNIANRIITKYQNIKGKDLRILLEALKELNLFPKKGKDALFHRCCVNDFGDVGSPQAMEKKVFKKGYYGSKKQYIKTDDELAFDKFLKFLKLIIDKK